MYGTLPPYSFISCIYLCSYLHSVNNCLKTPLRLSLLRMHRVLIADDLTPQSCCKEIYFTEAYPRSLLHANISICRDAIIYWVPAAIVVYTGQSWLDDRPHPSTHQRLSPSAVGLTMLKTLSFSLRCLSAVRVHFFQTTNHKLNQSGSSKSVTVRNSLAATRQHYQLRGNGPHAIML